MFNIYRVKKESDIIEIMNDNEDKDIYIFVNYKKINEEVLINQCSNDYIILIVDIFNYESNGELILNKVINYFQNKRNIKYKKLIYNDI